MADISFTVEDRRKRGYFTVDNLFLDEYGARLKPFGIAVYVALARFANQDQECWPSHETIAKRTGMSKKQVRREIAKLASDDFRLIAITPQYDPETREHKSNLYTLLDVEGGMVTQTIGGIVSQTTPMVRQTTRTILKKKDSTKVNKKGKSYRPEEYADIILG